MTDVKKALGAAIKSARTALEITQDQLAEHLGISTRYIMLLENAHKTPSFTLHIRIIRELNIQPDSVFYPEKPSKGSR